MTALAVQEVLRNANLEKTIPEALSAWEGATREQIQEVASWVCTLRDDLNSLLSTIDDEEQIGASLAIHYIELKSHWIALNTRMNYQLARGESDAGVVLRGTGISMLLAQVEPLIAASDVDAITDFLSQPINKDGWSNPEAPIAEAA